MLLCNAPLVTIGVSGAVEMPHLYLYLHYSIVERVRPRRADASLSVNHGGVAIVAVAGVRLKVVNVGITPLTFEYVAARLTIGQSS